jgi:hypothetical protein
MINKTITPFYQPGDKVILCERIDCSVVGYIRGHDPGLEFYEVSYYNIYNKLYNSTLPMIEDEIIDFIMRKII